MEFIREHWLGLYLIGSCISVVVCYVCLYRDFKQKKIEFTLFELLIYYRNEGRKEEEYSILCALASFVFGPVIGVGFIIYFFLLIFKKGLSSIKFGQDEETILREARELVAKVDKKN